MVSPVITVHEDCTLEEAAKIMLKQNVGGLPVVNARGEICGLVAESDFAAKEKCIPFSAYRYPQVFGQWMPQDGVERIYEAARAMPVREIMTRDVVAVSEDDSLETVLRKMLDNNFHRLPVLRGKTPVGIVSRHDLLRLVLAHLPLVSSP
jgi:CBS domain-containing protein